MSPWLIVTAAIPAAARVAGWLATLVGRPAPVGVTLAAMATSAGGVVWVRRRPRRATCADGVRQKLFVSREDQSDVAASSGS